MATASVLPASGETVFDRRGHQRALRVAWHHPGEFFVVSVWRDGQCAGTAQLDRDGAHELIAVLSACLAP